MIDVADEGHLRLITIDRTDRKNALDTAHGDALGDAFRSFEETPDLWVAVLTGAGDAFCTGNDLRSLGDRADRLSNQEPGVHGPGFATITKRFPLRKPVIAAINGYAVAGGLELALVCDVVICAESAKLGLTEVRWGLMPTGGGTQRLPRSIPRAWANYLILTGETIDAETACRIGLVSHVVPDGELDAEARKIGETIVDRGPLAVRAAKEAMRRGADVPLDEALAIEDFIGRQVLNTADAVEGPKAFTERRRPKFTAT